MTTRGEPPATPLYDIITRYNKSLLCLIPVERNDVLRLRRAKRIGIRLVSCKQCGRLFTESGLRTHESVKHGLRSVRVNDITSKCFHCCGSYKCPEHAHLAGMGPMERIV